jgi:hypothetical protein
MTNAEYIRSLNDDALGKYLFAFGINAIAGFLREGGKGFKDCKQMIEWVKAEPYEEMKLEE